MSNDEEARRARAKELRKKIAQRLHPPEVAATEEHPEMLPGESPNEYVERRMRELKDKKARGGSPRPAD
jgi:hypothetical protein